MWNILRKYSTDRPRRIYSIRSTGLGDVWTFLEIDEFRSEDEWRTARDRLSETVQRELIPSRSQYASGVITWASVWDSIIPSHQPSHWVTAGFRSKWVREDKVKIISLPLCLGDNDRAVRYFAGPMFYAIDALPKPQKTSTIESRDRAVFVIALLWTIAIAAKEAMSAERTPIRR